MESLPRLKPAGGGWKDQVAAIDSIIDAINSLDSRLSKLEKGVENAKKEKPSVSVSNTVKPKSSK